MPDRVDELMERASTALVATDYFEAERLCLSALRASRHASDFERMARICLPLQEARRQKRQLALDAGARALIRSKDVLASAVVPGLALVQPPLLGIDARRLRETADRRAVSMLVLAREPLTLMGRWPIVAVGPLVLRVQVAPPYPVQRDEASPSKDHAAEAPDDAWFLAASEALGDAAIARLIPGDHPHYRVDDLLDFLDAHPDHEKLHQRLEEACRAALAVEPPRLPRRRGRDDPYSF